MWKRIWGIFRKEETDEKQSGDVLSNKLTGKLSEDEKALRDIFRDCDDIKYKKVAIPALGDCQALLIGIEGLINRDNFHRDVIAKLLDSSQHPVDDIAKLVSVGELGNPTGLKEIAGGILVGKVAIIVDGVTWAYMVESQDRPQRSIEEPIQERLIRGPRVGFIEVIGVNIALIRRRLPDPNLKIIMSKVGRRSLTEVAVLYIEDICNLDTVREVEERINAIDIDAILETGMLDELMTERTVTPFPLNLKTERPDKVVGALLQGKVAIITDGSPFAMIVPATFNNLMQVPEDYYIHSLFASLSRLMRFVGLFLSTTLVAAYVAAITFHYEVIPSNLVIFVAKTREGVPFDPLTEALLLEFSADILREASIRLPGPIGPTLGIVGALILGQAAVAAHLVSPVMLFLVALNFILSSIIPNYDASLAVRWIRYPILVMAGLL